ncbi:unnamed protein product [Closterium sp. NIES-65]|nr:unnamed protein product [Closterium sp. NIES-65]
MALERMMVGDLAVRLAARGGAMSDERGGGAGWERRTDVLCESGEEGAGEGGDGTDSGEGKEGEKRKCGLINAPDDGVGESTHATADAGGGAYGMESTATPPRAASCDVSGAEVGSEGMQQATQQPLARSAIPKSVTTPSSASHFALGAPLSWAVLPDSVSSFLHSPTPLHHSGSDAAILLASDPASHAVAPLRAAVSPYGLSLPAIQDTAEGEVAAAQARQDAEVRGSRRPAAISHQLLKHPEEVEEGECDGSVLWSTRSERLFPPAWARSPLRTGGTRHEEHGEVARAKARRARGEGGSQAETGMLKMHTVNVAILAREANARQERLAEALRGVRVRQTKPSGAGVAEKAEEGTCKMEAAGGRQKHRHRRGGSVDLDARTPLKERTSRNQRIQGGKCNFVEDEFMGIVEEFLNRPKAKTARVAHANAVQGRQTRAAVSLICSPSSAALSHVIPLSSSPAISLISLADPRRPRLCLSPALPVVALASPSPVLPVVALASPSPVLPIVALALPSPALPVVALASPSPAILLISRSPPRRLRFPRCHNALASARRPRLPTYPPPSPPHTTRLPPHILFCLSYALLLFLPSISPSLPVPLSISLSSNLSLTLSSTLLPPEGKGLNERHRGDRTEGYADVLFPHALPLIALTSPKLLPPVSVFPNHPFSHQPCFPLCPDSFHPLPCSPPSPSLLLPTLCPAPPHPLPCSPPPSALLPPIPFPAPPHPLPCFPSSHSLLLPTPCLASPHPLPCFPPSPSLLPPIPFPASPHPLPCFLPSPSLLPPIPFPASPHPLPCFPPSPSLLHPTLCPAPPHPLPSFPPSPSLLLPIPFPASPIPFPASLLPPIPFPALPHPLPCLRVTRFLVPFPCVSPPSVLVLSPSHTLPPADLTACPPYRLPTLPPSLLIRTQRQLQQREQKEEEKRGGREGGADARPPRAPKQAAEGATPAPPFQAARGPLRSPRQVTGKGGGAVHVPPVCRGWRQGMAEAGSGPQEGGAAGGIGAWGGYRTGGDGPGRAATGRYGRRGGRSGRRRVVRAARDAAKSGDGLCGVAWEGGKMASTG